MSLLSLPLLCQPEPYVVSRGCHEGIIRGRWVETDGCAQELVRQLRLALVMGVVSCFRQYQSRWIAGNVPVELMIVVLSDDRTVGAGSEEQCPKRGYHSLFEELRRRA
ncbi:MAG: hypothetical protein JST01_08565 [Cyanobacteria bacterium SZAS TMP-1]|nr:hypothetical protein [Cyanobacteria bacterium SZAS TMP-1]